MIPADCDNDHSDNEKEWITENDIAEMFPNVKYILHYSRNHMKQKGSRSPRPRFHVIFSIEKTEDEQLYSNLKSNLIALYPFFDDGAKDSARFMFGTQDPQVIFHLGSETLSSFLKEIQDEKDFEEMGMAIPEGSRNTTMSRIGAKIIKRYGDTDEAKSKFFEMSKQCSPPLNDDELEKIWQGKQNFYKKISSQIGYVAPDKYNKAEPIEWETPIPFEAYNLPSFPTEALPEVIQKYVLAVSESTQTSPDMAAVEAIGITSLCVQGKYSICGNADWKEPLNTYIVVILPPAERKSSVLSMMTSPVETYETEKNTELSAEIIKSGMMLDKLEKEKRALVEKASKGKATELEIQAKATEIATYSPVKPLRLFVDDVTSEKLTSVLAENKGRAAVVSAEGGIFDIISGLYTKNVNIDVFLKGHSGDTIRVDRIGRASESIIHPALTMLLAVQPEVLNGLMSNNTFRGRGLTARFLYSMPKSSVGSRSFSSVPIPKKVKEGYQKLITSLLENKAENEPLQLLRLKGKTASDIALTLHLSVNTVRSHIRKHPLPNTVIVSCKQCGKHYRRKKTKTGVVWICSTYNIYGKAYCPSKAVPETVLTRLVESVGKIEDISQIIACDNNTLLFEMTNGDTIKKNWKDRSGAESWTDKIRAEVGRKARERNKK